MGQMGGPPPGQMPPQQMGGPPPGGMPGNMNPGNMNPGMNSGNMNPGMNMKPSFYFTIMTKKVRDFF